MSHFGRESNLSDSEVQGFRPVGPLTKRAERLAELMAAPETQTWQAILFSSRAIFACLESDLRKYGCSIARFEILIILHFEGPMKARDLVKRMGVTRGNISTFMKRLIAKKLVEFTAEKTSLTHRTYKISKDGIKEIEFLFPIHIQRIKQLVQPLDLKCTAALHGMIDAARRTLAVRG
jgi:DNA-binding MarR family transcriptional regulator